MSLVSKLKENINSKKENIKDYVEDRIEDIKEYMHTGKEYFIAGKEHIQTGIRKARGTQLTEKEISLAENNYIFPPGDSFPSGAYSFMYKKDGDSIVFMAQESKVDSDGNLYGDGKFRSGWHTKTIEKTYDASTGLLDTKKIIKNYHKKDEKYSLIKYDSKNRLIGRKWE